MLNIFQTSFLIHSHLLFKVNQFINFASRIGGKLLKCGFTLIYDVAFMLIAASKTTRSAKLQGFPKKRRPFLKSIKYSRYTLDDKEGEIMQNIDF